METLSHSKYTNELIGNTAFMLLNKPIGVSSKEEIAISGEDFASEMYTLKGQGKEITVKINSPGGSVKYGWDMVDSIIETKAKTENIGLAYSMAGICMIVGGYRTAYPHSRAMIHAPRRPDGKKDSYIDMVKDQFRTILKNYTKFTETEINDMIDSGKDYYFTAKQMLDKGMIDQILPGKYNNDVVGLPEMELYTYINKGFETETNNEMEILAKLFGGKTESENIVNAVQMKAENESLLKDKATSEAKVKDLEAKLATLETEKAKIESKSKAVELIEGAVKAGKFPNLKAEDKVKLIEGAVANYDATKLMIDATASGKTVAAGAIIETEGKSGEMTYEWLAKNNPKELNRIAIEDEALFNKLSDAYIEAKKEVKETK